MKVLWICSKPSSELFIHLKKEVINQGSWIDSLLSELTRIDQLELYYLFPSTEIKIKEKKINQVVYSSFETISKELIDFSNTMDVIHIHGSENSTICQLVEQLDPCKVVVSIQGLKSECAKYYLHGLKESLQRLPVLTQWGAYCVQKVHQKEFEVSGKEEIKLFKKLKHAIGRTHWDYSCVKNINPDIEYYHCQELMRKEFYEGTLWSYNGCKKNSIYITQGNYTIKGIHQVLSAFKILKEKYPSLEVRISGENVLEAKGLLSDLGMNYGGLIRKLIQVHQLEDCVHYIGSLDAKGVKEEMLKCNVFLLPSLIENSPNSLGEAFLTGTPCIASQVGGVSSLNKPNNAFCLYPYDDIQMLVEHITSIFSMEEKIESACLENRSHALKQYNKEEIVQCLLDIYREISK